MAASRSQVGGFEFENEKAMRLAYLGLDQLLLKCLDADKSAHDHSNGRNEGLGEEEHHGEIKTIVPV